MKPGTSAFPEVEPPDVSHLVTEDDARVDHIASEKQQRLLTEPLYSSWGGPPAESEGARRPFLALANVGMYAAVKEPPLGPDVLLSVDVETPADLWKKEHRCYFFWEYGKPPDVVIEIVSNKDGDELGKKKRTYARWRIAHYAVFDPNLEIASTTLTVFELRGDLYVPADGPRFDSLGLGLVEWDGVFENSRARWLRWTGLDGALIPTGAERAESEARRAEIAEARALKLAARLRALGVDPGDD